MARVYSVSFENVAVTAAQDFFEISPADDHPIVITGLFIDQFSDMGDAQEEALRYKIIRGHATSGSGGSAATPRPLDPGDAAAGFSAEINNTTIASAGTPVDLHAGAFNIRAGLALIFPPEMTPLCNQGQGTIVVRLMAAPADSLSMSGTLYVAEL
jgi:hypothetical protein